MPRCHCLLPSPPLLLLAPAPASGVGASAELSHNRVSLHANCSRHVRPHPALDDGPNEPCLGIPAHACACMCGLHAHIEASHQQHGRRAVEPKLALRAGGVAPVAVALAFAPEEAAAVPDNFAASVSLLWPSRGVLLPGACQPSGGCTTHLEDSWCVLESTPPRRASATGRTPAAGRAPAAGCLNTDNFSLLARACSSFCRCAISRACCARSCALAEAVLRLLSGVCPTVAAERPATLLPDEPPATGRGVRAELASLVPPTTGRGVRAQLASLVPPTTGRGVRAELASLLPPTTGRGVRELASVVPAGSGRRLSGVAGREVGFLLAVGLSDGVGSLTSALLPAPPPTAAPPSLSSGQLKDLRRESVESTRFKV